MKTDAVISCLMVTRANAGRTAMIARSMTDYQRQSHESRELVILPNTSVGADLDALRHLVQATGRTDIRLLPPLPDATLGELRLAAIAAARGDIISQWDDDDRSHPERLARQFARLTESGAEAVLLRDVAHYFPRRQRLYVTSYRATPDGGHAGTLMARATTSLPYPISGETSARGEDSAVVQALRARNGLAVLEDAPHLFIYVTHGENTWAADHHAMLADRLAISRGLLERRAPALRAGLAAYDWGDQPIEVWGQNGIGFVIPAADAPDDR